MKRIIIGTLVGTVIYFAYQSLMWEGGFHKDFYTYTPRQDTIMQCLSRNLTEDGLYMMPMTDAKSPEFKKNQEKLEKLTIGKPWVMLFYHRSMSEFIVSYLLIGLLYTFIACLLASIVLYTGNFGSFGGRFLIAMAFALFTLSQGVLNEMNWWSYPWSFVRTQVTDLILGWGICSVWLAWFVKKTIKAT